MNKHLQEILNLIQQHETLSPEQKTAVLKSLKDADKELEITSFKLDRTEKVKRTTAILLEETIEELEQKRKSVEAQNRELEIESSLERVRTVALSMNKAGDMLDVCKTIALQLQSLGLQEIRNVQTAIFYQARGTYMNYEFYAKHDKTFVTETIYTNHQVAKAFAEQMFKGKGEVSITHIKGKEVKDWLDYQKTTNVFIDTYLENATSLSYYWHSLGPVALGISTYAPLSEEELRLFQRFLNVFDLSYRRYLDIEKAAAQAQEAKIEASLERMRASAMSMRKSEELITVCEAMYKELTMLGFTNIRNAQIAIKNDTKQSYLVCEYSDYNVSIMQEAPYDSSPIVRELYDELEKPGDAFYQKEFAGKEFDDWRKWRKSIGTSADSRIEQARSMCFYLYSIGTGHLGISTFNAITKEQVEILKRFKNVFELSYRRYMDVAKAEAQAREAQIELALERVRARTMAMQNSNELPEAANLLFQQMQSLGMPAWSANYCIWTDDKQGITLWMCSEGVMQPPFLMPLTEDPSSIHFREAYEKGESFHVEAVGGDELVSHYKYMRTLPGIGKILDSIIDAGHPLPAFQIFHCAYFSQGFLLFITYEPVPEVHDIFKRFARVFEQTYTRFLDLQKAEAQARESQIEAALEKVRSRSMGMQKSDELSEVSHVINLQLQQLNFKNYIAGFLLDYRDSDDFSICRSDSSGSLLEKTVIPYFDHRIFSNFKQAKEAGLDFYTTSLTFDEKNKWVDHALPLFQQAPPEVKEFLYSSAGYASSCALLKNIGLFIENFEGIPFSKEENAILLRFAKVFEQTYTRFLDLQKAEAQAREAQIEAALEKVRSRSLAVRKSDEFKEVIKVVFERLQELAIIVSSVSINIFIEDSKDTEVYICGQNGGELSISHFRLFYFDHPISNDRFNAQQSGFDFFSKTYDFEEKNSFYKYLFEVSDLKYVPDDIKKMVFEGKSYTISLALAKYSMIVVNDFEGKILSEKEIDIVKRFSKVFEQAYIRFLDLQKAEEQAREAKIEAALERVRSRSMAMQKSEELKEVIRVVYEQFVHLNILVEHAGFIMDYKERDDMNIWLADQHNVPSQISIPYFDSPHWNSFNEAKEKGTDFFINTLNFEEKNKFYQDLFKHIPGIPGETKDYYFTCRGLAVSTVLLDNIGLYIENFSGIPFSDEENKTLMRFANVFQQTYTRFLDLQRAEAQALEAIKRASVDRVRAEIASMRTTRDLERIQPVIWNELTTLSVPFIRCGVFIMDEEQQLVHTFLSTPEGKAIATLHVPFQFDLSIIANGVSHWRKKEIYKEYWDPAAFIKSWIALSSLSETPGDSHQQEHPPENLYLHLLPFLQVCYMLETIHH